jgi:heme exporter protein D
VVALYAWLAVVITAASDVPVPLRVLVVFTFVLVGPGIPIIGLLRHSRPLEHFVLALMVSMSLATVLAEGTALLGRLTGVAGLAGLAGITTVAAVLEGSQERARQARLEQQPPDAAQLDHAESIS